MKSRYIGVAGGWVSVKYGANGGLHPPLVSLPVAQVDPFPEPVTVPLKIRALRGRPQATGVPEEVAEYGDRWTEEAEDEHAC